MIPYVNLQREYLFNKVKIDSAIHNCLDSARYLWSNEKLENQLGDYANAKCVVCDSGTNALVYALLASGVGIGDEVITVSHTYLATVEAIKNVGAIPIFVDVDDDFLINIDKIQVTNKTKAILFVDLYGQRPDVQKLRSLANQYGISLIEDAAQSFGCGNFNVADYTCTSFNPLKNLGGFGKGGAVFGKDLGAVRQLVNHGRINNDVCGKGFNGRMDSIQASVLSAKLPHLDSVISRKKEIVEYYNEHLQDYVVTPKETMHSRHTYYVYCIRVKNRDAFRKKMHSFEVETNLHYPKPVHKEPYFNDGSVLPNTEKLSLDIVSLPCYNSLTDFETKKVVEATWQSVS